MQRSFAEWAGGLGWVRIAHGRTALEGPASRGNHGHVETTDLLFFALAVLFVLGVVLLDRRLGRIQHDLRQLDELAKLSQKVASLTGLLDRNEVSAQLEAKLTEVAESEQRMVAAVGEVTREVAELRRGGERQAAERRAAEQRAVELPPEPEPLDVAGLVADHLATAGFDEVRLVSDLGQLTGHTGRVVFEAQRRGVMHKGHVRLSDGRIVEQSVRAAYSTFP
ncbi:MAG: hypothetical protein ACI9EF_000868 [Pseudohongiellaceae bacterium]|jgi:hypothetical protein